MLGTQAHLPGASIPGQAHMLSAPPALLPPGLAMQGHHGGMQLARCGDPSSLTQPGHDAMILGSPALSAGHPSPLPLLEMQQLQAARQQGRLPAAHGRGLSAPGYGSANLDHVHGQQGIMPQPLIPPEMHLGLAARNPMQVDQAQAMQHLGAIQHQQASDQSMGFAGIHPQQVQHAAMPHSLIHSPHEWPTSTQSGNAGGSLQAEASSAFVPVMDEETSAPNADILRTTLTLPPVAAYVMGAQPLTADGRLRGQGAGIASQHQIGNGDFEMEQEVTVKTKMKGKGAFAGNLSGSMQDSVDVSHGVGLGTRPSQVSMYPQTYDPRTSNQLEALGMLPARSGMSQFQQGW